MQPEETRYDRGLDTLQKMFGPGIDSALKGLEAASPDLARCLVGVSICRRLHTSGSGFEDEGNAHCRRLDGPWLSAGRT